MTSAPAEHPNNAAYFVAAFPGFLADDVLAVASTLPPSRRVPVQPFPVDVHGERVAIPYRVYDEAPDFALSASFSGRRMTVLDCLYTRHHDGRVRQRHLERILPVVEPWVAPFVVQLVGEYVVEIQRAIRDGLVDIDVPGTPQHDVYGTFLAANPRFLELTSQRVASYWDCYYRNKYPRKYYPGSIILESLRNAARRAAP
ncbi:hypothetical protein [Embleya hyalina]|uniref:Uncharacterized protein n=1 Tax=Embleya hyalina TaxID=516124 RepID=A0A401YTH1_9ACTN|nr:hypothetical protein [Embleya hyalina]GCD97907.1 hypothetical protein EHYA_05605 [Embleya hyalina]